MRLLLAILLLSTTTQAQLVRRVLFLGNSYTDVNSLPVLIQNAALSAGDSLYFQSELAGGSTLNNHFNNPTDQALIQHPTYGAWDNVVLQEQSQIPSFTDAEVAAYFYPPAYSLDSMVHVYSPCATTLFYMTWGRQNGDASNCAVWPPVCTYAGMDSLLHLRYMIIADSLQAEVSPVGAVWHVLRDSFPNINLYQSDGSHPSAEGSYAAACAFYTMIYKKDPMDITFNYSLSAGLADTLRHVTHAVVYQHLSDWNAGIRTTQAAFTYAQTGMSVSFQNGSQHASSWQWSFGDGDTSGVMQPTHVYAQSGTYTVTLLVYGCGDTASVQQQVVVAQTGVDEHLKPTVQVLYSAETKLLTVDASEGVKSIEVYDAMGRVVLVLPGGSKQVDVSALERGVYVVRVNGGGYWLRRRLFF